EALFCCGLSNPTPFKTYREKSEAEIGSILRSLANDVKCPEMAIFCIHVPPYGSGLDECPAVDADLNYLKSGGQILMTQAGSTAVRQIIENCQPLLSLHGHIHESRGFNRIGKTLCINPGSSYTDGILFGCLIGFGSKGTIDFQLTAG